MSIKLITITFLISGVLASSCVLGDPYRNREFEAREGVINLTNWDFDRNGSVSLSGEYRFKWEDESAPWETIQVPSNWNSETREGVGTGWYSLKVKLKQPEELFLYMEFALTSYEVYVDGAPILSVGKTGVGDDKGYPQRDPKSAALPRKEEFIILIKVSNYIDARGGIVTSPVIGRPNVILSRMESDIIDWVFIIGILGIMIIYHFVLWIYRRKDKAGLYFSILGAAFFFRTFVARVYWIFSSWIPGMELFWFEFQYKIEYISVAVASLAFLHFTKFLFYVDTQPIIDRVILVLSVICGVLPLVTPMIVYSSCLSVYHLLVIISILRNSFLILRAVSNKQAGGIPLLVGSGIFFVTALWDITQFYNPEILPYLSSKGLLILFIAKNFVLSKRYTRAINTAEYLSENFKKEVALRTRELQKANAYQSRFFANISHEFRTPLTLLLGPLEAIIGGRWGSPIPVNHPAFDSMYRNTGRLLKLVNNILSYSRIKDDALELKKERINLKEVLYFYVVSIQGAAESKQISLSFNQQPEGPVWAFADKELLEQAVLNLLSNALKFTPAGGSVILKLEDTGTAVCIAVVDTGIGIPEEYLSSIFERYRQLSDSKQKRYEGSGIGLALVRDIVECHGGRVSVASSPGEGSVFSIYLPKEAGDDGSTMDETDMVDDSISSYWLADMDEKPYFAEPEEGKSGRRDERILIVEDSHSLRGFLRASLEQGYCIDEAENGVAGIEAAEKRVPYLIISDIMMPDMDGYDFTRAVKQRQALKDIPVILLSAKADITSKLEGFEAGAVDYIVKPFNSSELTARVEVQLEMKRLRKAVESRNTILQNKKQELETLVAAKDRAVKQLAVDKAYFRDMADRLPSIVIETDGQGEICYMNRAAQEHFGAFEEGTRVFDILLPDFVEVFSRDFADRFDEVGRKMYEYNFQSRLKGQFSGLLRGCVISREDNLGDYTIEDFGTKSTIKQREGFRFLIIESDGLIDLLPMPDRAFYERRGFTTREEEVLGYILKGLSNKEIAGRIFVSEITVKKHVTSILQKTEQKNRKQLKEMIYTLFGRG